MTSQTKIPPTELLQPYFFITASLHPPSPGKFLFPSPITPSPAHSHRAFQPQGFRKSRRCVRDVLEINFTNCHNGIIFKQAESPSSSSLTFPLYHL